MDFVGTGTRLADVDLPRMGALIGVGEDEIHALLDVESAGKGFDDKRRLKMLFEPHVFYRELTNPDERQQAERLGLAYAKWGLKPYPSDSYPTLIAAMRINATAALRSASWGLGQIMGFNHVKAGFEEVESMIHSFKTGEAAQLQAMVLFIKNSGLADHLRRHRWASFARGYNGKGYSKHGYHTKLEAAYKKWSRIKDTPWSSNSSV